VADASAARQNDNDVVARASYTDRHIEGMVISLNSAFHYGLETYVDPAYAIDSFYKNRFVTVNPQLQVSFGEADRLIIGGEFSEGILDGNDFDSRIVRVQKALYVSNECYFNADRDYFDRASVYGIVRYDQVSDVAESSTPKIGLNVRIVRTGDVRIRASYGKSFRAPSFNDLYYRGFSNPQLKPEHSAGYDIGFLASGYFGGDHAIEATWFSLQTEDRILFDPTIFLPVNIGRTTSEGVEARYSVNCFDGAVQAGAIYTLTDALKKNSSSPTDSTYNKHLTFVPRQLLKSTLSIHMGPGIFNAVYVLSGERYTNEENSSSLPRYGLTHANVLFTLPLGEWKVRLKAEINNVFDVGYQVFPGYPMPGRTYRMTASAEY
jgi:outer membrane cobalamin receptor